MVAKSWAKLTLLDRLQRTIGQHGSEADLLRRARPFVVTERAAERVRDAMASYPEMIAENSEFALAPFDPMWIEFPSRIMLAHDRLSGPDARAYNASSDLHVGYLLHGKLMHVFMEGNDLDPRLLPIRYHLHQPMSQIEQQLIAEFFGVSRIGLDPFLWGHTLHDTLDPEHQRMLRARHGIDLSLLQRSDNAHLVKGREGMYRGSAGDVRNALALLLMINQPTKVIQTTQVPRTRGVVKGKTTAYWGHQLIDINLDAQARVNLLAKPKGAAHWHLRWHEVRGHFVHRYARGADHAHVWLPDHERDRRWRCSEEGCKAMRTWREYPEGHGSAGVGYVDQVRRVRTKRDQPASRA